MDGPIGHMWYKLLDKYVYPNDPQCNAAVLLKTAADQLLWAPIMTCVYFAFLRTVEGHPELITSTIQVCCQCFLLFLSSVFVLRWAGPCADEGSFFFTLTLFVLLMAVRFWAQAKLVQTVVANYVLWPAAHYINFKFVPTQVQNFLSFWHLL